GGVQVAENLADKGIVDAVIDIDDLAEAASRALDVLCGTPPSSPRPPVPEPPSDASPPVPAWESIERSPRADRPGVRELLRHGARDVTPLSGTGEGEADPGLLLALARFGAAPCVVVGQDRGSQRGGHPLGPAGLRVARRGMHLAAELGLPL